MKSHVLLRCPPGRAKRAMGVPGRLERAPVISGRDVADMRNEDMN